MFNFRKSIHPMVPYSPGRPIEDVKKDYNLSHVVKLASNENPYGCSPTVKDSVMATLSGYEAALYPDGYCTSLRTAVSDHYKIPQDQLIFGAGTDEVIAMLGKIFIEPGDEAITAEVTFSQYAASVEAMGGTMVYTPMHNHTFNLDALIGEITPKTKMIFIANPNNPTGTYFPREKQDAFMAKIPKHIVVVFDEAYQEYVYAQNYPNTCEMLKQYPNAILLKTFSKIYGIASYRIGFGCCHPDIVREMEKIRPPFNVTAQAQAAAIAALKDQDFVRKSHEQNISVMGMAQNELAKMGFNIIPSQANFLMVDVKRDSLVVFEKLMSKGYIVRAGAAFGMDKFIRITLGTKEEMEGLFMALREIINEG